MISKSAGDALSTIYAYSPDRLLTKGKSSELLVFASRRPFSTIGYNQRIASIIQATWDDPAEQRPPCAQPHDGITDGRDFPLITRHQFVIILLTSGLVTVFSVSLSLSMSNRNTATSDRLFSMLLIPVQYKGSSSKGAGC